VIQRLLKIAVVISALIPYAAHAGYVGNFAAWKTASLELQGTYLQGVMDGWLQSYDRGEASWITAQRKGLNKCLSLQKITATMLIDIVNLHYQAHNEDWRVPPAVVLKHTIQGVCLADINSERVELGLSPWDRKADRISKDAP